MSDRTRRGKPAFVRSHSLWGSQDALEQVRELGTGMPDEARYVGHLVTHEVAHQRLGNVERMVLAAAFREWLRSIEIDQQIYATETQPREEDQNQS